MRVKYGSLSGHKTTSKYRGVSRVPSRRLKDPKKYVGWKPDKIWMARILRAGTLHFLGHFATQEEAARAYAKAEAKLPKIIRRKS